MKRIEFTVNNFEGFYESRLSSDSQEQFECEMVEQESTDKTLADIIIGVITMSDSFDYDKYHNLVCKSYANTYIDKLEDCYYESGVPFLLPKDSVKLVSFEMTSPRYYNFETDKLHITADFSNECLNILRNRARETGFAELVKAEFTSREGFNSFHSSDVKDWLQKDITEWDNIKFGTLIDYVFEKIHHEESECKHYLDDVVEEVMDYVSGNNIAGECYNYDFIQKAIADKIIEEGYAVGYPIATDYYTLATDGYVGTDGIVRLEDKQTPLMFEIEVIITVR